MAEGRYRKKPMEIDAFQYDPGVLFPPWLQEAYVNETVYFDGDSLAIKTLEGTMRASEGDWVIKGTKGEIYPCKPDIFADIYERVVP